MSTLAFIVIMEICYAAVAFGILWFCWAWYWWGFWYLVFVTFMLYQGVVTQNELWGIKVPALRDWLLAAPIPVTLIIIVVGYCRYHAKRRRMRRR